MNKKILSGVLLGLAMTFGATASAQNNTNSNVPCAPENCTPCAPENCTPCAPENCTPCAPENCTPCAPENCAPGAPGPQFNRGKAPMTPTMRALAGINLTDAQKEQIKKIPSTRQNARDIQQQARQEYLRNLKNVLSPEQYTQFLENFFTQQIGGPQKHGQNPRLGQARKFDKKDLKSGKDKKDKKDKKDDRKK